MVIPEDKIISVSDFQRKFKEMNKKIENDKIGFIFKNNRPDKVIMTFEEYKKIIEAIELMEHTEIYQEVKNFEEHDTGERIPFEDAMSKL